MNANNHQAEISRDPDGAFTVKIGDKYAPGLTADEALWTIACYLRSGEQSRYLHTEAEWKEREQKLYTMQHHAEALGFLPG